MAQAHGSSQTSSELPKVPHWPAIIAILADACLYLALPPALSVGPPWLLLAVVIFLLIPIVIAHWRGNMAITRVLTLVANGVITAAMVASLAFLIEGLPKHREASEALLRSAVGLWLTNILVFALWYWRLDGGGPHERARPKGMLNSAFLFPQMLQQEAGRQSAEDRKVRAQWAPEFVTTFFWPSTPARPFLPLTRRCYRVAPNSG